MGARIESAATAAKGRRGLLAPHATRLSDRAARACLDRARRRADEVDLVVSAGVYREKTGRSELDVHVPGDVRASQDEGRRKAHAGHGLAFEVTCGGCSALSAAYLVDGLLSSGAAHLGLIAAADVPASAVTAGGFPFAAVGGAMVLSHGGTAEGFDGFDFQTFATEAPLFQATLNREGGALRGRYVLEVREDPRYAAACLEHARQVSRGFLARAELLESDVDLLIASQYPPGFARDLARELGVPPERVPRVANDRGPTHSAGVMAALEAAIDSGLFWRAHTVLFVTAGAGITIGVALYRR
jgi:3-oxoacyl-[acyl-carrier-protein] synthase-3